ncbi:MAG: tetratricopeptide repeat protein [Acidobacteriota bacterium]|nr:tetratricopeptide repeat protein [Acidobacteriota bacterium]
MSPLPVIQPSNRVRRSRSTPRRAAVLGLVHLAIAAHIAHWLVAGRTLTPVEPSEAAALAISGVVNFGLIFFAVTIVLTAAFGRFFCGWACHLVALQDLSRALLVKLGRRPKALRSRLLRWVPAIAFVYAFLWPAIYRLVAGPPLPEIRMELTTTAFWATFPGWIVGGLTFLVCGYFAVYFLGGKGFCTYACPYGAVFAAAERLAPLRIRVTDACQGCAHCTAACTSNVRVHEEVRDFGMVVDSGCMKCLDCVSVCPNGALYYGAGALPVAAKPRAAGRKMTRFPLTWGEEAVAAAAFAAAFFTFRGLYGLVPFLMALGLAGVLAFLVLTTFQLFSRPHLALKSWRLKRHGTLLPAAFSLLAGMALLLAFWAHSATVRYHTYRGDAGYRAARAYAPLVLDAVAPPPRLPAAGLSRINRGYAAFERVGALGLVESRGAEAKMAWMAALLERDAALDRHARAAIARGELPAEMHQLLGRRALAAGDPALAAGHFERAVAADGEDLQARLNLGVAQAQGGRLGPARATFEGAVRDFGESAALAYNLGLVEAWAGRLEPAAVRFAAALRLAPDHLAARENLAGTLAALGRFAESAEHYRRALVQSPDDAVTRTLLAQVLLALGRTDEAREQVAAALELAPGLPEALRLREALDAGDGLPP